MTVSFSKVTPLHEALKMTFGGRHPCALCNAVKHGKQSERESDQRALDKKIDLFCPESDMDVPQSLAFPPVLAATEHVSSRTDAPPRPPPRAA